MIFVPAFVLGSQFEAFKIGSGQESFNHIIERPFRIRVSQDVMMHPFTELFDEAPLPVNDDRN
jgi:hypothetical protein